MSKLTLSKKEIKAESYLNWKDEDIGKLVRHLSHTFGIKDDKTIRIMAAARVLCMEIAEINSADTKFEIQDLCSTKTKKNYGDWIISIRNKTIRKLKDKDRGLSSLSLSQTESGEFKVTEIIK